MIVVFSLFPLIWLLNLISVIWVTYDVITNQKKMPDAEKIIWILVALFLNLIGAIIYYLIVKASHKYEETPEERFEGLDQPIEI
ncbi:PLDc N-terminal domain-containing protein [Thermococcus gorgonarius]|uniref:Cardiolipin synthase N-terminal domain-containing protein n=1 Tax=Thermococcus gorgonarius TaxID=71997 RepID=A0A2Z2M3A0_THEGO|nr:PLDc N-terminal domain-containing protein [Thermococcus gorgonarius]ASJ00017.1 hypothetical protein A3K92_00220 [Thermococcus gorgonarius]